MVNLDRRKRARIASLEVIEEENGPSTTPLTSTHIIPDVQTAPKAFLCPLTLAIMFDPVQDGEGNSYERHAITKWLRENNISPISRKPLHDGMLIPNNSLRELIHDYMGREWVNRKAIETKRLAEENTEPGRDPPVCPYRTKVNKLLESATSHEAGVLRLRLNEHGSTAFRYEDIVVVLDVPQNTGLFHLYTRELILDPSENMKDHLLELNFLQGE
jgi:U-box domain